MKRLIASLTAASLALSLAACGGAASSSAAANNGGAASSTPAASSAKPTTVTVWHLQPEDSEETCMHQRLLRWAEKFNAENTDNITVEVAGAKSVDVILTTIATGSTPDIFMNYWNNAPAWSDKGALYDLTDFVNNDADWNKADFVDATWGLCTYNDHIYSIPYSMSTTFMVYRPDLLAEAGWDHFPANTEELLQCAMDCTKLDDAGNIVQMGLVPDYYWLDTILWPAAFGGTWMDGDTPDFTNKQQLEAYKFQSAILNKYGYDNVRRFVDSFGTPGTPEDALFKGKVAMRWLPDSALADMEEYGKDVEWAMAPMPYPEGVQGGQMLTCGVWEMNAHTENPEATWKVMASLTGEENMKFLAEGDHNHGTFMPRKSALNHVINDLDVSENTKKNATVLLNDNLTHFPMVSYIGEYLNIISTEMNEALMGNISVEDAAQKVRIRFPSWSADTAKPAARLRNPAGADRAFGQLLPSWPQGQNAKEAPY